MTRQRDRRSLWAKLMSPVPMRMLSSGTALVLLTFSASSFVLFTRLARLAAELPADGYEDGRAALVNSLLRTRTLMPLIFLALAVFSALVERGRKKQVRDETAVICAQLRKVGAPDYQRRPLRRDDELIPIMSEVDSLANRLATGSTREIEVAAVAEGHTWPEPERSRA